MQNSKTTTPVVLASADWIPSNLRYMPPKVNDRGAKSINLISTQTNRSLHISTPLMMTWGISDFIDEKTGEPDGKFTMSLNFPNPDYETPVTKEFLTKLKAFENQVLDDAVKNSEVWFGEELEKSVVKHNFFPFIKYPKDKNTKKIDLTKAPSIRAKVPNYSGRWNVEIYDTKGELLFPSDNPNLSPQDFIPKQSNVACVLQCGGLWFGGKGWGITWKLNQCVVKPREVVSVFGKCHIQLSTEDIETMSKPNTAAAVDAEDEEESVPAITNTQVEDSDAEEEDDDSPSVAAAAPQPVKKVVKKVAVPEPEATTTSASVAEPAVVKKKVVVKKKAV
uniref:Uncharacterized protein n=1 Tax=viral metagenome TaxID=1070528 RepID=A0A6C0DRI3_9ZZZZ